MRSFCLLAFLFLATPVWGQQVAELTPAYLAEQGWQLEPGKGHKQVIVVRKGEKSKMADSYDEIVRGEADDFYRYQKRVFASGHVEADTVVFDAKSLMPIKRISYGRKDTLIIAFEAQQIITQNKEGEKRTAINQAYFDSNILDHLCVLIALNGTGAYKVPLYSSVSDKIDWYTVELEDTQDSLEIDGTAQTAIRVSYTNEAGRVAYVWVDPNLGDILKEGTPRTPNFEVYAQIVREGE